MKLPHPQVRSLGLFLSRKDLLGDGDGAEGEVGAAVEARGEAAHPRKATLSRSLGSSTYIVDVVDLYMIRSDS